LLRPSFQSLLDPNTHNNRAINHGEESDNMTRGPKKHEEEDTPEQGPRREERSRGSRNPEEYEEEGAAQRSYR
jgi:hypothetical protein